MIAWYSGDLYQVWKSSLDSNSRMTVRLPAGVPSMVSDPGVEGEQLDGHHSQRADGRLHVLPRAWRRW